MTEEVEGEVETGRTKSGIFGTGGVESAIDAVREVAIGLETRRVAEGVETGRVTGGLETRGVTVGLETKEESPAGDVTSKSILLALFESSAERCFLLLAVFEITGVLEPVVCFTEALDGPLMATRMPFFCNLCFKLIS